MATRERSRSSRVSAVAPPQRPRRGRRVRAYVGLGANLGDAAATLAAGVHALAALPGARLAGVSRLYATRPVGVTDQPEFRNAVVALDVPAGPGPETGALALLLALKAIERAFGRRARERWGPRELDLDLLVFGRHALRIERPPAARSADPATPTLQWLQVPHPSARERLFVLAPLADLAPGLRPPGWGETVASARTRARAREGADAVRPVARWDRAAGAWGPRDSPEQVHSLCTAQSTRPQSIDRRPRQSIGRPAAYWSSNSSWTARRSNSKAK